MGSRGGHNLPQRLGWRSRGAVDTGAYDTVTRLPLEVSFAFSVAPASVCRALIERVCRAARALAALARVKRAANRPD
jgi:hypothetical protein